MIRYSEEQIRKCVNAITENMIWDKRAAKALANVLVEADMYGVHTHGLAVLASHIEKVKRNGYCLGVQPEITKELPAMMTVDAGNSIGMYSAIFCMEIAVKCAQKSGIFTVFCKKCNSYGAAFYYSKMAVNQKMIGITFCNSPAAMAPWGGYEKMLGTNPLAVGIPGLEKGPILFDMATSIVAKSKINEIRKRGESIPEGWALDTDGNTTTDPVEAIKGLVLPMAGAKGYGLAMMIDILAGMLSGADYLSDVGRFYSEDGGGMNVGQVFVAIDPRVVLNEDFYKRVDGYIDRLHQSKIQKGKKILFPGERKLKEYKISKKEGIELSDSTINSINEMLKNLNMDLWI